MERLIRNVADFEEAERENKRDWQRMTGDERLAHGESLRRHWYLLREGDRERNPPGLRRILRVVTDR